MVRAADVDEGPDDDAVPDVPLYGVSAEALASCHLPVLVEEEELGREGPDALEAGVGGGGDLRSGSRSKSGTVSSSQLPLSWSGLRGA